MDKNYVEKMPEQVFELAQESVAEIDDGLTSSEKTKALCRSLAAEGCLLVKNEDLLPIEKSTRVAVFGRCQLDYFYVGYGSGGDVKAPYRVSPMEGFEGAGVLFDKELAATYAGWCQAHKPDDKEWGHWPMCYDEMPLDEGLVSAASDRNDMAIVFIGRSSGEDREAKEEPGSWYLTAEEENMLALVTQAFDKVCLILNVGAIMDMTWMEKYPVQAVLFAWQGGQESGNAIADVVTGVVNPSGRLADTIAPIETYPSYENFGDKELTVYKEDIYVGYRYFESMNRGSVIYPFGFGLSYTTFDIKAGLVGLDKSPAQKSSYGQAPCVKIGLFVENTGDRDGKTVAFVFMKGASKLLGRPERELVAFEKTPLLEPGQIWEKDIIIDLAQFAAYDDTGATGHLNSYVLEAGGYEFYAGADVRAAEFIGGINLEEYLVRKTQEACPPDRDFDRLAYSNGISFCENVKAGSRDLYKRVMERLPEELAKQETKYSFLEVAAGKIALDDFVASLSVEELEVLSRGSIEAMNSPYGAPGNASAFGGCCDSLQKRDVPAISTNDGPSGCRLQAHSTLFPTGAVFASSFNLELVQEVTYEFGREVVERNSHALLAPGMNIHRHPLCGRNFEYFSEDPYVTGKMGAAFVKGIQASGASAVPKHVCCNNQETGRNVNNAVVSQRALREIYLKGFEICIREAKPHFLMNSYNKINGVYTYYNYDLCRLILRDEFGFDGLIMTDWWIKPGEISEFPQVTNHALRVRAGNNLYMPGGQMFEPDFEETGESIFSSLQAEDGLTLGELQRNVKEVLTYCLRHVDKAVVSE